MPLVPHIPHYWGLSNGLLGQNESTPHSVFTIIQSGSKSLQTLAAFFL